MRAVLEGVIGGGVGHGEGGGQQRVDRGGQGDQAGFVRDDLLGKTAPAQHPQHLITDLEPPHTLAQSADDAHDITARREREGRLELVFALDD